MRWFLFLLFVSCTPAIPHENGSVGVIFCQQENCEHAMLGWLGNASDIECAFYDLELESLEKLLMEKRAEVKIHNRTSGLMHHKFCVLDDRRVITGSMNPTENGVFKNDNNLLMIDSERIARAYEGEFFNVYNEKYAKGTIVSLDGVRVEVRFCPQEPCEAYVLRELYRANESIRFMTFTFTSDPIGEALLDAADRGVLVEGVFERRQSRKYSEYDRLKDWGLDVRFDDNPATMHHKVFIIDEEVVITGSYNPTKSATTRNDENLIFIDDAELASEFLSEFHRVWGLTDDSAQ